jgi:hypothetical protein
VGQLPAPPGSNSNSSITTGAVARQIISAGILISSSALDVSSVVYKIALVCFSSTAAALHTCLATPLHSCVAFAEYRRTHSQQQCTAVALAHKPSDATVM